MSNKTPHRFWYFTLCYLGYSAFTMDFAIRGTIGPQLLEAFQLNDQQLGVYFGQAFWGVAIGSVTLGWLVDRIGYRTSFIISFVLQITGIILLLFAYKTSSEQLSYQLSASMFLMGLGEGGIFAVIHPLLSSAFPDPIHGKTRIMNFMHTNWPLLIVIAALMTNLFEVLHFSWRADVALLIIFPVLYLITCLALSFPDPGTQLPKIDLNVRVKKTLRPGYILLLICMVITSAVELGPQEWITTLMQQKLHVNGLIFLIFAEFIQGLFRLLGGRFAKFCSPPGLLSIGSLFTMIGLYLFSISNTVSMGLIAALIFGIGVAWFWPTLMAIVADRYPQGGSFAFGLMNCVGFLSVSLVLPAIGKLSLAYGPNYAFRFLAWSALIIFVLFGLIGAYHKRHGGYKAIAS